MIISNEAGINMSKNTNIKDRALTHLLTTLLSKMKEVRFAYLFGFYAKGDYSKRSDIDIAIYLKKEYNDFDTKLKIHHKLEVTLHKDVDLVILNSIKNFNLLESILNNGIIIKDSQDDTRIMYELNKEHEIKHYLTSLENFQQRQGYTEKPPPCI